MKPKNTRGRFLCVWVLLGKNAGKGHAVVVTGVNVKLGLVFTNNPHGIRGIQTFESFQRGFTGCKYGEWHLEEYYYVG